VPRRQRFGMCTVIELDSRQLNLPSGSNRGSDGSVVGFGSSFLFVVPGSQCLTKPGCCWFRPYALNTSTTS
jgi:hypothetical protein